MKKYFPKRMQELQKKDLKIPKSKKYQVLGQPVNQIADEERRNHIDIILD